VLFAFTGSIKATVYVNVFIADISSVILETVVDRFVEDLSQRVIWGMAVSVFTAELPPASIDNSVGYNVVLSTQ
jgi:hypothetical protein